MTHALKGPIADRPARLFVTLDGNTTTPNEMGCTRRDAQRRPVILRNWSWNSPFTLTGRAYGHPRFTAGTRITTSVVLWIDETAGYAQTLNTFYRLVDKAAQLGAWRGQS